MKFHPVLFVNSLMKESLELGVISFRENFYNLLDHIKADHLLDAWRSQIMECPEGGV